MASIQNYLRGGDFKINIIKTQFEFGPHKKQKEKRKCIYVLCITTSITSSERQAFCTVIFQFTRPVAPNLLMFEDVVFISALKCLSRICTGSNGSDASINQYMGGNHFDPEDYHFLQN